MPFDENTYVAHWTDAGAGGSSAAADRNDCIVFDPGLEPAAILSYLDEQGLAPAAILCTHGHSDHIAGNAALKRRWPECPLVIGVGDEPKLSDPQLNLSAPFGVSLVSPPADGTVDDADRYEAAGIELDVLAAPGHSAGHVVFLCRQTKPWRLFGGDVLFRGSIGRTDFPDGDFDALRQAIHEKLFTLPEDTIVLPGHGPQTTIGHEKRTNPFVGAPAGYSL
jgi:glyoxylase-like metal-dependent hydrolase (beta-lactamase superfamily II)